MVADIGHIGVLAGGEGRRFAAGSRAADFLGWPLMPTRKPYRRYRSRSSRPDDGGLDELRQLNAPVPPEAEGSRRSRRRAERAAEPAPAPSSERRPGELDRDQRRALAGERRRWWSFSGVGPAGFVGRLAAILAIVVVAWGAIGLVMIQRAVGTAQDRITDSARAALSKPPGGMLGTPTTILVIGKDGRRGETRSRADTIMLIRTDPDAGRIRYLSIPRDIRVNHPIRGTEKINASFRFGGQAGTIRAVRRLTGLPIHHVVVVNFRRFPEVIDGLGGITVINPTAIVDCPYEAGQTVSFRQGRISLDGDRALIFSRIRKCDDDFRRVARQQAVTRGIKDAMLSWQSLPLAPWRGAELTKALATDMGTGDLMKFAWLQARLDERPQDRQILTGSIETIGEEEFIIPDPGANEIAVARFLGRPDPA